MSASTRVSRDSCRVPGPLTLNHTRPAVVSKRIALDHGRACGCSHSPVSVADGRSAPAPSASCAATQLRASATKAGEVHRSTGMT